MQILSVPIDIVSFLLGGAVCSFVTVLYFVFFIKSDWEDEFGLSVKDEINKAGKKLTKKGKEIEKDNAKKSRSELIDSVSK